MGGVTEGAHVLQDQIARGFVRLLALLHSCHLLYKSGITCRDMEQQCTYDGRDCSSLIRVRPDRVKQVQELGRFCRLVNKVLVCSSARSVKPSGVCMDQMMPGALLLLACTP